MFDIRQYVYDKLDRAKDSAGAEVTAECPDCEKFGSFYVNADSGAFVCFSCEFRGKTLTPLVAHVEGLTWEQARRYIFKHSVELRRREDLFTLADRVRALRPHAIEDEPEMEPIDVELPRAFRPVYLDGKWALPHYLKKRHIKSRTARAWRLGFCRSGRYAGRLIIPIVCPRGRSWTARDMTDEQEPKYLNPPGADHRQLLIGWNMARMTGDIVLVEGPTDAIRLWQHNLSALGLGGKELHDEQRAQLFALPSDTAITVILDPEERKAPFTVAEKLAAHFNHIYIGRLPDGVDPGKSSRTQAYRALDRARKWTGDRTARLSGVVKSSKESIASRWGEKKMV
jgi:DNA primase